MQKVSNYWELEISFTTAGRWYNSTLLGGNQRQNENKDYTWHEHVNEVLLVYKPVK